MMFKRYPPGRSILKLPAWSLAIYAAGGLLAGAGGAPAPGQAGIQVRVTTDRQDALYQPDEPAVFAISVCGADGGAIRHGQVDAALTLDGGRQIARKFMALEQHPVTISGTLAAPGFLRCTAAYTQDGQTYTGMGAAGFAPDRIAPTAELPDDFDAFWEQGRRECAALPLDLQLSPLPQFSTAQADCFALSFAHIDNTRMYGYFSIPKDKTPPYPAIVSVPSAGIGKPRQPDVAWAARGALALDIGVHAVELGLPREKYAEYARQFAPSYTAHGIPDREKYYYYRVILGVDRAIAWLTARPDFDRKHLVLTGASQGGGLSLIMAGLNPRVTAVAAAVPALCDHRGAEAGRQPGWPGLSYVADAEVRRQALAMFMYYDAVNFARKIPAAVAVIVGVGFVDTTCCPSSVYAAYNVIRGPKRIYNAPDVGHAAGPEYAAAATPWIRQQLGL